MINACKMASIRRQKSGRWRVQVRRKGRALSETSVRYDDAKVWALEAEREIDRGESPRKSRLSKLTTFGDLIDLHIADMKEVGKAPGRSKDATLKMLKRALGKRKLVELDRNRFIDFGKARAAEGAALSPSRSTSASSSWCSSTPPQSTACGFQSKQST